MHLMFVHFSRKCQTRSSVLCGSNFNSVTMLDWVSGKPTAAYWVLKLLVEEFGNREKRLYPTTSTVPESVQCAGPARETGPVNASCGGSTITALDFFSYGTPEGSCRLGNLSIGKCNAARNLTDFVAKACIGQHTCEVNCPCATADCKTKKCTVTAGGRTAVSADFPDPCVMVPKFVALRVQCKSPPPEAEVASDEVFMQAIEVDGLRKALVVNKQATARTLHAEGLAATAPMRFIAADDPWSPIRNATWGDGELPGFFVGVVRLEG